MMRYSLVPLLLCVTLAAPPATAVAADDTTWLWQLLSGQFGGTPHSLGYSPHASQTSGGPDMGAFFMGGDDGGVWRSLDCGATWAPVNGGAAMSNGVNGGYLKEQGVCTDPAGQCTHGIQYGGALSMRTDVSFPVTAGRAPGGLNAAGPLPVGDSVVYRPEPLSFSRDDGLNWFRLSPACMNNTFTGGSSTPETGPIAVDQGTGHEGHIVVAGTARDTPYRILDASGCTSDTACAARQIAWTNDATPQMNASIAATNSFSPAAGYLLDKAGGPHKDDGALGADWKFSSLNHLAVSAKTDNSMKCLGSATAGLPLKACHAKPDNWCHGVKPDTNTQLESACLGDGCICDDDPKCRYPVVMDLAIDPRNGYVYASTTVGLLLSIDGGSSWQRAQGDPGPNDLVPKAAQPHAGTYYNQLGVQLLTGVTPGVPPSGVADAAGAVDTNGAWDLNQSPWRIVDVGKMALVFTPALGANAGAYPNPNGRARGTVEAYLPVTWQAYEQGHLVTRSSVFHAQAGTAGDGLDVLTFRDVNTTDAARQRAGKRARP